MRELRHRERCRKFPAGSVRRKERDGWVDQSAMMFTEMLMIIPSKCWSKSLTLLFKNEENQKYFPLNIYLSLYLGNKHQWLLSFFFDDSVIPSSILIWLFQSIQTQSVPRGWRFTFAPDLLLILTPVLGEWCHHTSSQPRKKPRNHLRHITRSVSIWAVGEQAQ